MNMLNMDGIEFLKSLPDGSVDLVFTDPPYNISKPGLFYRDYRSGKNGDIRRDFGEWDYNFEPEPFLIEAKRVLSDDGQIVIWTSEQLYGRYHDWLQENMFPRQMIVWEKTNPVPQFRLMGYLQATELMIWATKTRLRKSNPNFIFMGQSEMKNIFRAPIVGGNERIKILKDGKYVSHPTQKPLSICREIVKRHCRPDGMVVDPYAGTGTILLAAHMEGRNAAGSEIDVNYYDAAKRRLSQVLEVF